MERGDEDFANEIQVTGDQGDTQNVANLQADTGDDWHQTFLEKHDRLSFAQQRGLQASQQIGFNSTPQVEYFTQENQVAISNLKKSSLSILKAMAVEQETEQQAQR